MFQDQQYMELVSHVSSCPYINQGLYDCPYCNKEERFCWDVPYPGFNDSKGALAGADSMAEAYGSQMAPAGPQIAIGASTHQFQSSYGETEDKSFPEVFVNDQRASRSPNLNRPDSSKRKYDQFSEPVYTVELPNESISVTSGEYAQSQNRLAQHQYIVELPNQNAGRQGSRHLSRQTSPEMLNRNVPSIEQTMQMDLASYGLGVSVGRDATRMMAGFSSPQASLGMGSMMPQMAGSSVVGSGSSSNQTAAARGRDRALSSASIVPSQGSPSQRLISPSRVDTGMSMQPQEMAPGSSSRPAGSESSAGGAAEAEKGSVTCKQCGKVLRGKIAWLPSNLQRHMREIHLSAPKTECRVCGRTFNRGHNLRHHMKAVHGEQP